MSEATWCVTHEKGPFAICRQRRAFVACLHLQRYCSICWQTENVQIRLQRCARSSAPSLIAYDKRAFFQFQHHMIIPALSNINHVTGTHCLNSLNDTIPVGSLSVWQLNSSIIRIPSIQYVFMCNGYTFMGRWEEGGGGGGGAVGGGGRWELSKLLCLPSKMESTSKGKNLLPLRKHANSNK